MKAVWMYAVSSSFILNVLLTNSVHSKATTFTCPKCNSVVELSECFRDRAVELELKNSIIKCINPSCPWEGEGTYYQVLSLIFHLFLASAVLLNHENVLLIFRVSVEFCRCISIELVPSKLV